MKKVLLVASLLIAIVFISGCVELYTQTPQGSKEIIPLEKTKVSTTEVSLKNLEELYENFRKINITAINCSNYEYFSTELMNLTIMNWVYPTGEWETAMWYPSLSEGRIGNVLFELKNIGCTKIKPVYNSYVFFGTELVYWSQSSDVYLIKEYWPGDAIGGNIPVSGKVLETLNVKKKGTYTVFITIVNPTTKYTIGIDRLDLVMK